MDKLIVGAIALGLSGQVHATEPGCVEGRVGYSRLAPGAVHTLVMQPPVAGRQRLIRPGSVPGRGAIIAQQEMTFAPLQRFLAADVTFANPDDARFTKGVPLMAGSQVTVWRGPDGERNCSIGWVNGLFGTLTSDGTYRWLCFEDKDGDGAYESAWHRRAVNLLSTARVEMAISPPVRWTSDPPVAAEGSKRMLGALGGQTLSRQIEVRSFNKREVRLEYWGEGIARDDRNRATLKADEAGAVTMGGIEVKLTPIAGSWPGISATGSFDALPVVPTCNGSFAIGSYESVVTFNFMD